MFSLSRFFLRSVFWFFEEGKESSAFERRGEERRGEERGGNPLFFSLFVKTKKYLITHREKETLFY